jgi:Tol biopolymer transport system component
MRARRALVFAAVVLFFADVSFAGVLIAAWPRGTDVVCTVKPAAITRLTFDPGYALHATWSPDGCLIAFESSRDGPYHIYVMNADGSHPRALTAGTNDDRDPVWTADGKTLLYDSSDGNRQDIWSVDVRSGKSKQLTHADGLASFPSPSPDCERFVFYVYKDMTLNLWTARVDGTGVRPLTTDLTNARREQPTIAWHRAAWSPDGQWVAYTGGDGRSIWMMRGDGGDAHSVICDQDDNHFPRFLPDGRLGFITEHIFPTPSWTDSWAYDLKTGQRTLLVGHMAIQGPMDWSADGSRLLFFSPRAGRFDIYLIDLNVPGGLAALQGKTVAANTDPAD